jgi:hypothetical protein
VRLTREETIASLRRVSRDGARFTFAADAPKVRTLTPGAILLVWGIALRKVVAVEPRPDGLVVRTEPAALGEAITDGKIAWRAPADFGQGMVSWRESSPDTSGRKHALLLEHPLVRYAGYVQGEGGQGDAKTRPDQGDEQEGEEEGGEEDEAGATRLALGEAGGYEFEVGWLVQPGRLDFELEMAKGESGAFDPQTGENLGERTQAHGTRSVRGGPEPEAQDGTPLTKEGKKQKAEQEEEAEHTKQGAGKVASPTDAITSKGLFGLANEMLDFRVRAKGHVNDLTTDGDIELSGGSTDSYHAGVHNLQGDLEVRWIARLGAQQGVWSDNIRLDIPFNFDIPLVIGGLPFMIELGTDLLVAPALTSHYASATATYQLHYGGDVNLTITSSGVTTDGDLSGDAATAARQITSVGVSAVLIAVQAPRIGFGLGLLNTSTVAYVDQVMSASITSAGNLALIPCRRYELNRIFHAGVDTKLLGLSIPMLGTKKELGTPWRLVEIEPKGYNCGT